METRYARVAGWELMVFPRVLHGNPEFLAALESEDCSKEFVLGGEVETAYLAMSSETREPYEETWKTSMLVQEPLALLRWN